MGTDTFLPGEDDTLGWFDWLFKRTPAKTVAKRATSLYDQLTNLKREIGAMVSRKNVLRTKINTNARLINQLRASASSLDPADGGDATLGWLDWIFKPKKKSKTAQLEELHAARRNLFVEFNALDGRIRQKRLHYDRLYKLYKQRKPTSVAAKTYDAMKVKMARTAAIAKAAAARTAAYRAPIVMAPPVTAAMSGLTASEQTELLRRMRMGWAQRPGAPDMPGEAAAMFKKYGVTLDPERLAIDEELFV